MQPSTKKRKAEVCDICGDCGFEETIVTCSKCNVNCEHVYCMKRNTLIVPKEWICEPCKSKDVSTSPRKVNQGIGSRASKMLQPVKTGKVRFLPEYEVIRLSSGNFPLPMTQKTSVGSKYVVSKIPSLTPKSYPCVPPPKVHGKLPRDEVHKKSMTNQHASCSLSKGPPKECIGENQLPLGGVVSGKKYQTHDAQKENPTKGVPFEALSAGPPKECIGENQPPLSGVIPGKKVQTHDAQKENHTKVAPFEALSAGKSSRIVGSGGIPCADAECNKFNIVKSDIQSVQENLDFLCKFLPSSVPAWRGQFQILQTAASSEFYDGFEAQPPCIVNKKAYKFSKEMPSVLQLESLPVLNALNDIFQDNSPRLQDVALYFFPSEHTKRSRKNLNSIFKFMNAEKSMLRSYIDGVELLVFTSSQLDIDSRGAIAAVDAGHFLWGMFRRKKINKAIEGVPEMEPVDMDMDIDMIGGKDMVGRADNVQKYKPKSASFTEYYNKLDVPPGFEEFTKKFK